MADKATRAAARVRRLVPTSRMNRSIAMVCATALIVSGATATAQSLIDSGDVQDNSLRSRDIRNRDIRGGDIARGTISLSLLKKTTVEELIARTRAGLTLPGSTSPGNQGENGAQGPQGPQGAPGTPGTPGAAGADGGNFVGENWGIVDRNTIGSPAITLRAGPTTATASGVDKPPFGAGSLSLLVGKNAADTGQREEKAAFGNQVDFFGDPVSGLDQVGFRVWTSGENSASGVNMPNIAFEIDPNLGATASNFSTMVFVPAANSPTNTWSGYIDATDSGAGSWYLTGAAGTATGCNLSTMCSFAQLKTALNDGGDAATILIVQLSKGRDKAWQGAIDGLRINGEVFDFEQFGVVTTAP